MEYTLHRYTRMHALSRSPGENAEGCALTAVKGMHNKWMASKQTRNSSRSTTLLDLQRVLMKGRRIVIPEELQQQTLEVLQQQDKTMSVQINLLS